ncbi:hypothetical protein Dsin_016522 [Dipteronia sinensis]|uniref:WRKY domain-containing protein n=1 Tax=Dipteronia sinensis TaxID=43782 RepID=A0AAE0ADW5_9ROSI|nr:hypothetical protein Dsin_016522 [Dipteronia sinensis]
MNYPKNPSPNFSYFYDNINPSNPEIEVSDYLVFEDGFDQEDSSPSQSMVSSEKYFVGDSSSGSNGATSRNSDIKCRNGMMKKTKEDQLGHSRVAFRTKSELEVMDDGFKWRKYGKKSVKNSPNPRNYYKCSSGGCNVKKRVERDREDQSYVITTYDGIHNHESPCVVYYNTHVPLMLPSSSPPSASANWAFQKPTSHSSSSS